MTRLFWDVETCLIQPACLAPPIVAMVYAYDDAPPRILSSVDPLFDNLIENALRSDVIMVAHYASFEMIVTMARKPEWTPLLFAKLRKGQVHCTLVREKLIRIAKGDKTDGYGLDDCCKYWKLPITLNKQDYWRSRYGTLYGVPVEQWPVEARDYLLGDMAVRDVYWAQEACRPEWLVNQHHQVRADVALALTSARGFWTDVDTAKQLYEETVEKIELYKQQLLDAGLVRWEKKKGEMVIVKTKKAAEERIVTAYAAMGRDPPRAEPTEKMVAAGAEVGNICCDKDACTLSRDPLLIAYSVFGQASTLLTKVRRLQRRPIQTRYDVLKATGRTSSSQGDDPKPGEAWTTYGVQIQNLARSGEQVEE